MLNRNRQVHGAFRRHRKLRWLHKAKPAEQDVQHGGRIAGIGAVVRISVHGIGRYVVGQHKCRTGYMIIVYERVLRSEQCVDSRKLTVLVHITKGIWSGGRGAA